MARGLGRGDGRWSVRPQPQGLVTGPELGSREASGAGKPLFTPGSQTRRGSWNPFFKVPGKETFSFRRRQPASFCAEAIARTLPC